MAFIVFEGLDASGKTTQIKKLAEHLEQLGHSLRCTREPGGTALGEELRALLLRTEGEPPCPLAELLIYEASRAQHVERVIRPALQRGEWVLCDRFAASTVAFQSAGRSLEREKIDWLNRLATQLLVPDLTVLIDISVEESQRRKGQRSLDLGVEQDRFEQEKRAFHEAVRHSYLQQSEQDRWLVVDGQRSAEAVFAEILTALRAQEWLDS